MSNIKTKGIADPPYITRAERTGNNTLLTNAAFEDTGIVLCDCGHAAFADEAEEFGGRKYCGMQCLNDAVFAGADGEDFREYALCTWEDFVEFLRVNADEMIGGHFDGGESAGEYWSWCARQFALADADGFCDWYCHRGE